MSDMRVGVPKERAAGERRVALVPESCRKLVKAGIEVIVESGAGDGAWLSDDAYREAGAALTPDVREVFGADLVLKVQPPGEGATGGAHEAGLMRRGAMLLCPLAPSRHLDTVRRLAEGGVTTFSTAAIPRISRAQSMDVLSSMASLAGYKAVLLAADALPKYFPMLMTAAGTVLPAKVFVIGAGVAGLQAIATARRLGATVEATDTRPAVRQEVESLGARFVGVTSDAAQAASGYAREMSDDLKRQQAEIVARHCAAADVVITTALVGGTRAPKLVSREMVAAMRPGSVIVDLAAPGGGNCGWSEPGTTVERCGVRIVAPLNLPGEVPTHGSLLLSRNLTAFVLAFWKDGRFRLDLEDEILKAATITHDGRVLDPDAARALARQPEEAIA
jgi:NAD(P) transhydrogenase subunit alpha